MEVAGRDWTVVTKVRVSRYATAAGVVVAGSTISHLENFLDTAVTAVAKHALSTVQWNCKPAPRNLGTFVHGIRTHLYHPIAMGIAQRCHLVTAAD